MKPSASPTSTCSTCGATLEQAFEAGIACPACLLRIALTGEKKSDQAAFPRGGRQFGTYVIEEREDGSPLELGRGAMGITFCAIDHALERKVALKIIDTDLEARNASTRERFMRGARAAAVLRHENVATIYQFGIQEETGQCFYAMELVEGETLEERVCRAGPLPPPMVVKIARQIVAALAAAEKQGLVHRDLKPSNIMLAARLGDIGAVKVIDFGLAKAITTESDPMNITHGGFIGTPAFASPEQFARQPVDVRSDIFSLGVTLWFALTGKTPFAGRNVEEIQTSQRNRRLPIEQLKAARVPPRLTALLQSMLAVEPVARPDTAQIAQRLRALDVTNRGPVSILIAAAAVLVIGALVLFGIRLSDRSPKSATRNSAAREALLKGRHFWNRRGGSDFEKARVYFEKAIALDSTYAEAYAGLGDAYQFLANGNRQVRDEYYAKARQMSRRAIELDPRLSSAHASLGLIAMNYDWGWSEAEREFKRALELNPDDPTAHQWYAACLVAQGRFDEALAQIERARELDPLSSIINTDAGQLLIFAGRLAEAEERLNETLRLDPHFAQAHYWMSELYGLSGRYAEGIAEVRVLESAAPSESPNGTAWSGQLGWLYALAGNRKAADEQLALVQKQIAADQTMDHLSLLLIYLGLGRTNDVFACLEDEYRAHSTSMTSLKVNPLFRSVSSDPRYLDLLRRVHLAP